MGYGDGSVYKRGDGFWIASVPLPSPDGRRRRKTIARKNKADAIAERRRLLAELARSGDLETASPTVEAWVRYWLDHIAAPRLKPRTLDGYRRKVDLYIIPTIGRHRLSKLTARQVRAMSDHITGSGLSSTTALQTHAILRVALRDAVREGKVARNVADAQHIDAPRRAVNVRPALTAADARTVLIAAERTDTADAAHWGLALMAGLRQGERLGLTADMVDLERGMITVAWQLQRLAWQHGCAPRGKPSVCGNKPAKCPKRTVHIPPDQEAIRVHGGLWLTRPKSRAGWREVPIVPPLDAVLTRHITTTGPGPHGLIFHTNGRPIDPSRDAAAWDTICRTAGVPDVPLHSARHTTSTLLADLGAPEDLRMKILGHSSATVTRGYTHRSDASAREWMTGLGALLTPAQLEG